MRGDTQTGDTDPAAESARLLARLAELEARESERVASERLQDALYRIAEAASASPDLLDFYRAMHRIVGELMDARNFYIALYDAEMEAINFPYYVDTVDTNIPDPAEWEPFGVGNAGGLTAYVLRTGEPALVTTQRWQELIAAGQIDALGESGEDWLGVPLHWHDQVIGIVVVQTYEPFLHYREQDVELLTYVGRHIAAALARARAIEETRQRNAELTLVNEIGQALAAQLEFEAIIDIVGERIRSIFDVHAMFVALYDAATDTIAFPYDIDEGERFERGHMKLGPGLTSTVIQTKRPLRIGSAEEQESLGAIDVGGTPTLSWLGVPILSGERVIGVVALESLRAHAFSESDERLLTTLASSMGVALDNARLLGETKRLLVETDERAAELAIINGVQEGLASQLEMQAMYDLVGDKLQEIFDAQVVDIGVLDEATQRIHFPYSIERGERFPDQPIPLMGIRRHVMATRQPFLVQERSAEVAETFGQKAAIQGEVPKSTLWAPMVIGEEARGVISLQNLDREFAFSEGDVRLLTTVAASLSVALENARLFGETRRQAAELAIVNRIGQALSAQLDLDALIELVGERMRATFAADIVYVALHDADSEEIQFPYYSEDGLVAPQPAIPYGTGLTSRIVRDREPLLLRHAAEWDALGDRGIGTQAKTYLGVPILQGDTAIGVISVQSTTQEGRFGDEDVRLLSTLAANVGAAISNARLYEETRRRAREMAALAEVGREISANLDLTAVLEQIVERAQSLLSVDSTRPVPRPARWRDVQGDRRHRRPRRAGPQRLDPGR